MIFISFLVIFVYFQTSRGQCVSSPMYQRMHSIKMFPYTKSDNFIHTIKYGTYKHVLGNPVEHQDLVRRVQIFYVELCQRLCSDAVMCWLLTSVPSLSCHVSGLGQTYWSSELIWGQFQVPFWMTRVFIVVFHRSLKKPKKEADQRNIKRKVDMEENEKAVDLQRRVL